MGKGRTWDGDNNACNAEEQGKEVVERAHKFLYRLPALRLTVSNFDTKSWEKICKIVTHVCMRAKWGEIYVI